MPIVHLGSTTIVYECAVQTQKAVHIVITTVKDGLTQTNLERKIPLVTIRSIAMSNLRDDWLVRNLKNISSTY